MWVFYLRGILFCLQVAPLHGVVVSRLQFSLHGLFIFYSVMGQSCYSSFKVVDDASGQLLCSMDGLVEYTLVSGGRLPLFMSHSILSMCLGALSTDPFVSRLCEIVPEFASKEVDRTLCQPVAFKDNIDVYAEFIKIIFSLHSNSYRTNLKKITEGWRDEVCTVFIKLITKDRTSFSDVNNRTGKFF